MFLFAVRTFLESMNMYHKINMNSLIISNVREIHGSFTVNGLIDKL